VLLVRQLLDGVQRLGVGPAEVGVRLAHAGHERRARAVDDGHAGGGQRAQAAPDALDAVALDQDFARKGLLPGTVENANVREEDVGHGISPM
jgi:hypothetical protein